MEEESKIIQLDKAVEIKSEKLEKEEERSAKQKEKDFFENYQKPTIEKKS